MGENIIMHEKREGRRMKRDKEKNEMNERVRERSKETGGEENKSKRER